MKNIFIFLLLFSLALCAFSVPADRSRRVITLSNGACIEVAFHGDEYGCFYLASNGRMVWKTERGFEYATSEQQAAYHRRAIQSRIPLRKVGNVETAPIKPYGKKYIPLILVSFADKDFSVATSDAQVRSYYELYCNGLRNGTLYTDHGSRGSIKDYFLDQSHGQFEPEFIPIGPIKLDSAYAYYGADSYNSCGQITRIDVNFSLFRNEAIVKALQHHSNWDLFDNDLDGSVDMVYFVYAGLGQNSGGDDNTIWPKESTSGVTIAGKYFATSAACCEVRPSKRDSQGNVTATKADGIGVFIHELSHALGLPDFYDTQNVAFGMDIWSVMDYGMYCNNGYNPSNYTAYERHFMGWEELPLLTEPTTLHLGSFAQGYGGYKIMNDANPDEYYVIENRQAHGWDDYLGRICTGLQVTHVDFLASAWSQNRVNVDSSHQRMTIIAANNCYKGTNSAASNAEYLATLRGNLFPGSMGVVSLTDETLPASVVYNGEFMGKPLFDITEHPNGILTLKYCPLGVLSKVDSLSFVMHTSQSFTAYWDTVSYAQAYRLRLISETDTLLFCDSLKTQQYTFENLYPNKVYSFSVQPIADDYRDGPWSQPLFINTSTGVHSVINDLENSCEVFDVYGRYLGRHSRASLPTSLRPGFYFIKHPDGTSSKCFIK